MLRVLASLFLVLVIGVVGVSAFRLGASVRPDGPVRAVKPSAPVATSAGAGRGTPTPGRGLSEAEGVADAFVDALLDPSRSRDRRLSMVTSERLAQLLARTDPAKIPSAEPIREIEVVATTEAETTLVQRLSDGSSLSIDLVPDPDRPNGWVVTGVRPGER